MRRITIGIDTSQRLAVVAAFEDGRLVAFAMDPHGAPVSETLNELVARVLAECGAGRDGIAGIVVSNGPGSATGLRVGIAFARGLADALALPCDERPVLETLRRALPPALRSGAISAAYRGANVVCYRIGGSDLSAGLAEWPDLIGRLPSVGRQIVITSDLAAKLGPHAEWPAAVQQALVVENVARLLIGSEE